MAATMACEEGEAPSFECADDDGIARPAERRGQVVLADIAQPFNRVES
jgi:hypothetical protein